MHPDGRRGRSSPQKEDAKSAILGEEKLEITVVRRKGTEVAVRPRVKKNEARARGAKKKKSYKSPLEEASS